MSEIKVGDTVRSFDFPDSSKEAEGKNACFVEGEVVEIGRMLDWQTCDMYKIKCDKKMFSGKKIEKHEEFYYAPLNGTRISMGGVTHGVVKVN